MDQISPRPLEINPRDGHRTTSAAGLSAVTVLCAIDSIDMTIRKRDVPRGIPKLLRSLQDLGVKVKWSPIKDKKGNLWGSQVQLSRSSISADALKTEGLDHAC